MIKISIPVELSEQFLRDILCVAVEGGSNYWARFKALEEYQGELYLEYQKVRVEEYGNEDVKQSTHTITLNKLAKGVQKLIARNFNSEESHAQCHPKHSAELMRAVWTDDAVDSDLADLVLQMACFGHIIYG